jgi:hypothetical protein
VRWGQCYAYYFRRFCQISAQYLEIYLKNIVMIMFLHNLAVF